MSSDPIRTTLTLLLALTLGGCGAATATMVAKPGGADDAQRGLLATMSQPPGKLTESLFRDDQSETFAARKDAKDIDFNETIAKANQQAIARARLSLADDVKRYFDARAAVAAAHAGGS